MPRLDRDERTKSAHEKAANHDHPIERLPAALRHQLQVDRRGVNVNQWNSEEAAEQRDDVVEPVGLGDGHEREQLRG